MKTSYATILLLTYACMNLYGQDSVKLTTEKGQSEVRNIDPYIITVHDGKTTIVKNPKFDWSKVLKRDTTKHLIPYGTTQIYTANADTPIIKKYVIYSFNSAASEYIMPRKETMAKYHSRAGVTVVHLKPGIVLLDAAGLLRKFNVSKKNANLPLYIDFRAVSSRDSLLAVPAEVLKIKVIKDTDGFRFLNITTKTWDAEQKKNAGKIVVYVR